MWRKILAVSITGGLVFVGACITAVGPWPAYGPGHFENAAYYRDALAAIDVHAARSHVAGEPGPLQAGWHATPITPKIGLPLAGYGDRMGRPSKGVRDEIFVKAVALGDGRDTVVIVGSDMLIVPPNIAESVREQVAAQTPLTADNILFNANHTHSGPGGLSPGFVPRQFWGPEDADIIPFLTDRFAMAIIRAYQKLAPARLASGSIDAPDFIRNRVRDGAVDPALDYLLIEQEDGDQCYVVRYSAHATVLGGSNMEFSGDYPGYLQRAITEATGAEAVFLGGAVGSMAPRTPAGDDMFERAQALGEALAALVTEDAREPAWSNRLEIASVGIPFDPPPVQLRMMDTRARFSPVLLHSAGLDLSGWMHAVRIGDLILAGTPCDFSGEIAIDLRAWAGQEGFGLWCLSFNGAYLGYVTPDRYYKDIYDDRGNFVYETGIMSWTGPDQEAFFSGLIKHMAGALRPDVRS